MDCGATSSGRPLVGATPDVSTTSGSRRTLWSPTIRENSRAVRASFSLVEINACFCAVRSRGEYDKLEFDDLFGASSCRGDPVATAPGSDTATVATARPSPQPRGNGIILPGLHSPDGSNAARTCNIAVMSSSLKITG